MTDEEIEEFHDFLDGLIQKIELRDNTDTADRVALTATAVAAFAQRLMSRESLARDELNAYVMTVIQAAMSRWEGPFQVTAQVLSLVNSDDETETTQSVH